MVASLLSNGHASIIGLQSTSINPLPIASKITLHKIPAKGFGSISGKNASPIKPAAEHTSENDIQFCQQI